MMQNATVCQSMSIAHLMQNDDVYRDVVYVTSVINGILMVPVISLNGIIIITLLKTQSLRSASNWFLGNLMLTDLLMGLLAQPLFIITRVAFLNGVVNCDLDTSERFFSNVLPLSLMLTLTASSVDRYLAIRLMLRYRSKMTTFRAIVVIIILWLISLGCGFLACIYGHKDYMTFLGTVFLVCLTVTFVSYFKAFLGLKQHQNKVSANDNTCINVKKYQRSFATMSYVFLLQLVFYTPDIYAKFMARQAYDYLILIVIADTVVYTNAALNPVFFIWRMRDVRRACKRTLKKMLGK